MIRPSAIHEDNHMRRAIERISLFMFLALTSTWPILLAGVIAGQRGVLTGLLAYLATGALFLTVLALGGIRGILGG
jgi:hypothetical protein